MWDEDEYVDTGGSGDTGGTNSAPRTPLGGPAARRINQQRKIQAQTVKLPKNPFIDPETADDYADMTGHHRDETGMEELRSAHHHKSMKIRSQSTTRLPSDADSVGSRRDASDMDLTRNMSTSSSRSGSQGSRFQRSNTSPGFATHQNSSKEKFQDVSRNGSVTGVQPVIKETDGTELKRSGHSIGTTNSFSQKQNSLGNVSSKSQLPASSPALSGVSVETSATFLKQSAPASPAVVYKSSSDNNIDDAQVAVVIEETGPATPSYSAQVGDHKLDDKSRLKFETPLPKFRARNILLVALALLLIIGLAGVAAYLGVTVSQQSDRINSLNDQIKSLLSSAVSTTFSADVPRTTAPDKPNLTSTVSPLTAPLSTPTPGGGVATEPLTPSLTSTVSPLIVPPSTPTPGVDVTTKSVKTSSFFTTAEDLTAATNTTTVLTTATAAKIVPITESSTSTETASVTAARATASLSARTNSTIRTHVITTTTLISTSENTTQSATDTKNSATT